MTQEFRRRFVTQIAGKKAAPVIPWYLTGEVPAANCIEAYAGQGAESYADSKINLANPGTYDIVQATAAYNPKWNAADGWMFDNNPNTQVLPTGYSVVSGENKTHSMIIKFSNATAGGYIFGLNDATFVVSPNRTNTRRYKNGNSLLSSEAAVASGVMALCGGNCYLDGVADGTVTLGNTSGQIFISTYAATKAYVQAVAIYNIVLTAEQVAAITDAMNAIPAGVVMAASADFDSAGFSTVVAI